MTESRFMTGVRIIAAEYARDQGEGMTQRLRHETGFPSYVNFEDAASGLLGDVSGQQDIISRSVITSEDSGRQVLELHLQVIFRARLFKLLAKVIPAFLAERRDQLDAVESELNTLLRLMANASGIMFYLSEAADMAESLNLLNRYKPSERFSEQDIIEAAISVLDGANKRGIERVSREPISQGLVPVLKEDGIGLRFVPVHSYDSSTMKKFEEPAPELLPWDRPEFIELLMGPDLSDTAIRTPLEWLPIVDPGILIADPDGWRSPYEKSFDEPIGRREFLWRYSQCTIRQDPNHP